MKKLLLMVSVLSVFLSGCGETKQISNVEYISVVETVQEDKSMYTLIFKDGEHYQICKTNNIDTITLEKGRKYDLTVTIGDKWTVGNVLVGIKFTENP